MKMVQSEKRLNLQLTKQYHQDKLLRIGSPVLDL